MLKIQHYIKTFWSQYGRNNFVRFGIVGVLTLLCIGGALYNAELRTHAAGSCGDGEQTYTIQRGDTLGRIAARNGLSLRDLATRNHIANVNIVYPGQAVCLPGNTTINNLASQNHSSVVRTIYQVFGAYGSAAVRVANCESSLNPNAYNYITIGNSHAAGLFQVLYPSTWYTTSQGSTSPYNAYTNAVAAHEIFVRDGYSWREWVCQPW